MENQRKLLDDLNIMNMAIPEKLNELESIENHNHENLLGIKNLMNEAKKILNEYPGKEMPLTIFSIEEAVRLTENLLLEQRKNLERALLDTTEYEALLHQISEITKVGEELLEKPISVTSLRHLQEEMQRHRKFFVNLIHSSAVLQSLADNLDDDTKNKYQKIHNKMFEKAEDLLDRAVLKSQEMSLAASRWTVLENAINDESKWLQVIPQRIPDLQNVTSNEYEHYTSLYQVKMRFYKNFLVFFLFILSCE